ILDFSKIDADQLVLENAPFDLDECLADAMKPVALKAHERGLELAYYIPRDVPKRLVGDALRLRQILLNLVTNAVKFTREGEIIVSVEFEDMDDESVQLRFSARDTGIGIPADKQASIFNAFSQADDSTTRKFGGTGLGLAIVQRLSGLMNGRAWVESEEGAGSTFFFTARFGRSTGGEAVMSKEIHSAFKDRRVLVVHPNAAHRQILCEMLEGWSMRPSSVDAVDAAVTACEGTNVPFSTFIMDAAAARAKIDVLARVLGANRETPPVLVLLMTTTHEPPTEIPGFQSGRWGYVVTPVRQSDLFDSLARLLCRDSAAIASVDVTKPAVTETRIRPSLRILLAEDNPFNQEVAIEFLRRHGHEVTVAHDGAEAVEKIQGEPFDLVLMDVQMPRMGGFEATAAIREMEENAGRRTPIFAMTAHAMKGDRERCIAAGMDGYVSKPFAPKELFAAIDQVIDGRARETPTPAPAAAAASTETVLDIDEVADLMGGREDAVDLLKRYGPDLRMRLAAIDDCLAARDAASLVSPAHALKGMLLTMRAAAAGALAAEMEQRARAGDIDGARGLLEGLASAVDAVLDFIEDLTPAAAA
ncbi:MAG: response regulator, partial [Myxococcales bacterium]|nr:response regulator [Myxococcales bacterium]